MSLFYNILGGIGIFNFILLLYFLRRHYFPDLPAQIPRVGSGTIGHFTFKTRLRVLTDCQQLHQEAYNEFTSKGRTCILPGIGLDEVVALPTSSLQWWGRQPGSVLSAPMALARVFKSNYVMQSDSYFLHPWLASILKHRLSRFVQEASNEMQRNMKHVFDVQVGGMQDEWKMVEVNSTMGMIISHLASCFSAIGEQFGEDPQYIRDCHDTGMIVLTVGGTLGFLPPFLQPLASWILCVPMRRIERRIERALTPAMHRRLKRLEEEKAKREFVQEEKSIENNDEQTSEGDDVDTPVDRLDLTLRYGMYNDPFALRPRDFARRWIADNMAVIDQTSHALTNLILNILDSDAEYNTISIVRAEIQRVLSKQNGEWNKTTVSQMVLTDSVMRETLRMHTFGASTLRIVAAPEGITTADGFHLPQGTAVTMLSRAAHLNPHNHQDPGKFDPFRFARPSAGADVDAHVAGVGENGFVTLSGSYLPFGYGRHACPGRHLVHVEFKMILAYFLLHYDIRLAAEHKGLRPPNICHSEALFPPRNAKMEVRRRTVLDDISQQIWQREIRGRF